MDIRDPPLGLFMFRIFTVGQMSPVLDDRDTSVLWHILSFDIHVSCIDGGSCGSIVGIQDIGLNGVVL